MTLNQVANKLNEQGAIVLGVVEDLTKALASLAQLTQEHVQDLSDSDAEKLAVLLEDGEFEQAYEILSALRVELGDTNE